MKKSVLKVVMRRIAAGKLTRAGAAARLGVGPRHVNRLMAASSVVRPRSRLAQARAAAREEAQEGRDLRHSGAVEVMQGDLTLAQAARKAECSERTIRRWIKKLAKTTGKSKKRPETRKISKKRPRNG